jgi:hypothetical protein
MPGVKQGVRRHAVLRGRRPTAATGAGGTIVDASRDMESLYTKGSMPLGEGSSHAPLLMHLASNRWKESRQRTQGVAAASLTPARPG